jgi:starch-binding outer membrane protein, SusD/RagB family
MRYLKYACHLLVLGLLAAGCKKQLDIVPTGTINEINAFQTVADLEQGVRGVYSAWDGANTMYINAILSDEVKLSNENLGEGQFEFKYQFTSSSGAQSAGYQTYYAMINRANRVLEALPKITASDAGEDNRKSLVRAELLALRAYAHFELLQRFGPAGYSPSGLGVTYVNYVFVNDKLGRNTVGENLAAIEADLAAAKAGPLPNAPGNSFQTTIRLNKSVIAGMQARVALYKREWTNAINYATECINLSGKSLASKSAFPLIWLDESEVEVLLKRRSATTAVGDLWQSRGIVDFEPADKLKSQFHRTNDIRFKAYFKIDPGGQDTALIYKFYESARNPNEVDVKLMRIAEMYLIRAEARAENNDLVGAATDLNTLRAARINNYTNVVFTDKNVAIAEILNERYKELCFEGFRFFDLKRRQLPLNRFASDVQSPVWQNISAGDYRFVLPIPQHEIFANPKMVQNPGY